MEQRWNDTVGKTKELREKLLSMPLCPPLNTYELLWMQYRASTVRSW
jgi:hypothetical protein